MQSSWVGCRRLCFLQKCFWMVVPRWFLTSSRRRGWGVVTEIGMGYKHDQDW